MIRQLLLISTAAIAGAQPPAARMSVPQLGFVFDGNSKSIRVISGVPGAASLDSSVPANISLDSGFVHSRAQVAFANTKEGSPVLIQWSATPQTVSLTTSLGHLTQVAFSLAGDQAALTDGNAVEVWTGLAGDPVKSATFTPDQGVTALAMNANGLVAAGTGAGVIVLLGEKPQQIASGGQWQSLAFLPNGTDLLAADAQAQNVTLIRNVQTDDAPTVVLNLNQGPDAVAAAADGTAAVVASAGNFTIVNLVGGQITSVACNCRATRFDRMTGNLVLHVTDSQSGSELLLDADATPARLMTLSTNGVSAQ